MKKFTAALWIACLVLASGCGTTKSDQVLRSENVAASATEDYMERDDAGFYLMLDSTLKSRMTQEQLSEELDSITRMYGTPLEMSDEYVSKEMDANTQVSVPVRFNSGWMDFTYVINSDGSISSFKITASDKLDEQGYNETRGTYTVEVGQESIEEVYVHTRPNSADESTPLVILIHGKDAYDRNSTVNANRTFRALAYQLADSGISTVRYDRTVLNHEDLEDTPSLILNELRELEEQLEEDSVLHGQKTFLFGYGLGGYLLPYLAASVPADGYIIANAPAENLAECLADEQKFLNRVDSSNSDEVIEMKDQQIDAAVEIIHSLTSDKDYDYKLLGYPSAFWVFVQKYDALQAVQQLEKPILVIQGSNDYEVPLEQFNAWESALAEDEDARVVLYKDMDHLFIVRKSDSRPQDSMTEGTLAAAMMKDLASFVLESSASQAE